MNKEVELLEGISALYAKGDIMDELLVEREATLVKAAVPPSAKALEIGCGNGFSTERFAAYFADLTIVEPAAGNIQLMQAKVKKDLKIFNGLLEDFKSHDKYAAIMFLNVLEHVEDPISSLNAIAHLLTDDGKAFISVPNSMSLNRRAGYHMGVLKSYDTMAQKDYDYGHRRMYHVDMLKEHIAQSNLELVELKGAYLKPLAERQMVELGLEVIKAFHQLGEDVPQYCANIFAIVKKRSA